MNAPTLYQPLSEGNGLLLEEQTLSAYREGQLVCDSDIETVADLDFLLESYMIPALLPECSFSYTPAQSYVISMNLDFSVPGTLFGSFELNGQRDLWRAECVRHGVFLHAGALPPGVRPWADNDEPGTGWQFVLPPSLRLSPDPVLVRRVTVALEAFVYAIDQSREIDLPYRRAFDNVFSADKPMWSYNLPRIAEIKQSARTSLPI